jgi:hypothetical protein
MQSQANAMAAMSDLRIPESYLRRASPTTTRVESISPCF